MGRPVPVCPVGRPSHENANTELLFFLIQPLLKRQKSVQNFVGFFVVWENLVFCFRDLLIFSGASLRTNLHSQENEKSVSLEFVT